MTMYRLHPSVRPPSSVSRANAGAAPATAPPSRTTVRALRWLPLAAVLLSGAASPAASGADGVGAGAAADTLRVSLAPPDGGEVAEGAEGSFSVTVGGSTAGGAVTVRYTVSGTAVAGSDYTALSGEVTVAQGDSTAAIVLSALADDILDDGETVVLRLASATGAQPAVADTASATATITDDGTVTVEITPVNDTVPEGEAWATTVTMSSAVSERVTVRWRTSDGTAAGGTDYEAMDGSLVFEPGERSKPITVKTIRDGVSESVEMFYVGLQSPAAAAWARDAGSGAGGGVRIDTRRRSGFIECSVEFPEGWEPAFTVVENADSGTVVGMVTAAAAGSSVTYSLSGTGADDFSIDGIGEIRTTRTWDYERLNETLSYELTVKAVDACGAGDSIDVDISITDANDAPEADAGPADTVTSGDPVTLSGARSDQDGTHPTWGTPSHTFSWRQLGGPPPDDGLNNANMVVADFVAPDVTESTDLVFRLTVMDGGNLSDTDEVTITVKPPPCEITVAASTRLSLPEDERDAGEVPVQVSSGCRDVKYTLRYTSPENGPDHFSASPGRNGAQITAAVALDYETKPSYDLTLTVRDTALSVADSGRVTIEVQNVNEQPTAIAGEDQMVFSGTGVTLSGASSDPDGTHPLWGTPSHTFSWEQLGPPEDAVTLNNANMKDADFRAPDVTESTDLVFRLTVMDGGGFSDRADVTITMKPPPCEITVAASTRLSLPEDERDAGEVPVQVSSGCRGVEYTLRYTSPENGPDHFSASPGRNGAQITAAVALDFETKLSYDLTLTVRDTALSVADSGRVTIEVRNVNEQPTAIAGEDQMVFSGTGVTLSGASSDPDGTHPLWGTPSHTFLWEQREGPAPPGGLQNANTATANFEAPPVTSPTSLVFRLTVTDGKGLSDTDDVTITVKPPPCTISIPAGQEFTVDEGSVRGTEVGPVGVDATNCGTLEYEISGDVFAIDDRGVITVKGTLGPAGTEYTPVVTVSSGDVSDTRRVTIEVTAPPPPPCTIWVASSTALEVREDGSVAGEVPVTVSDGCVDLQPDELTGNGADDFTLGFAESGNTEIRVAGSLDYETKPSYDLELTVRDGSGVSDYGSVAITVENVNEAPRAEAGSGRTVVSGAVVPLGGSGTDPDGSHAMWGEPSLAYLWEQRPPQSPAVTLRNATSAAASFTAPPVGSRTRLVFRLTVTDGGRLSHTDSVTVTVDPPPNRAPTANAGPNQRVGSGTRVQLDGSRSTDSDGTITGWAWTGPLALAGANTAAPSFTAPPVERDTDYTFKLTVTDNRNATGTDSVTVTVYRPNRAPTANAGPNQRVGSGTRVQLDGSRSTDSDGTITGWAWTGPLALAGANTAAPSFTAPPVERDTDYTFKLTVTDNRNATGTATVTVTVYRPNRAPTAEGTIAGRTVRQGATDSVDVSGYFNDADGDPLVYEAESSDPVEVEVAVRGKWVVFDGLWVGGSTVTVTARDPGDLEATQEFGVTVRRPNRPPAAVGTIGTLAVARGAADTVAVRAHFSDPDGDRLTYTVSSADTGVVRAAVAADTLVVVTGVGRGSAAVRVRARDPGRLEAVQTFTVTVPNRAPAAEGVIAAVVLDAGGADTVNLAGRFGDADGDTLTYTAASTDTAVARVSVSGTLVAVRALAPGAAEVRVTADDGHGGTGTRTFAVTVRNRAPAVAGTIAAVTVERGAVDTVDVADRFRDPDDEALTYTASSSDTLVAAVSVDGTLVLVSGVARGGVEVTVAAADRGGLEAQQVFTVTVPNSAPVLVEPAGAREVEAGDTLELDLSHHFRDPDGDTLAYTASSSNGAAVAVVVSGSVLRVAGIARGEATVILGAEDGHGGAAKDVFTVTVPNRVPLAQGVIAAVELHAGEADTVNVRANFSDPDGDALAYTASSSDTAVTAVTVSGTVLFVRAAGRGEAEVAVTADDGHGGTATQVLAVTVANRAPVADAGEDLVAKKGVATPVWLDGTGSSDPDGDELSYRWTTLDGGGVSLQNDTTATPYFSAPAFSGFEMTWRFRLTVSDGHLSSTDEVSVTVRSSTSPEAVGTIPGDTLDAGEEARVGLAGYFEDRDGDALAYTASSSDEGVATAELRGDTLVVAGVAGGSATLTAEARDEDGQRATQRFEVTVVAPNTAPAFGAAAYERAVEENAAAGTPVGEPVVAADANAGDTVAYRFIRHGAAGLFGIGAATGLITVAADAALDYERGDTLYTVSVEASDGLAADTAVVTIRITNADDPGVVTLSAAVARVGVPLAAALEDEDGVGGGVRAGWEHAAGEGAAWSAVAGANAASYTPVPADSGRVLRAVFTYTDGHGPDKTAVSAAVRVAGVNRAPAFAAPSYERAVEENAAAGTAAGAPVAASDADGDTLRYRFVPGGGEALFEIGEQTGRITVAAGTVLDYESGDTLYTLRIEASDGTLADTAVVTIRVTDQGPPGKPGKPEVTGGTGEAAVAWAAPVNEGAEITSYDLRYRAQADTVWTVLPSLGAVLSHTIGGLDPGTTYLVGVRAESSEGAGEWSELGEGTTAVAPPNRAPVFEVDAYSRTARENAPAGTAVGAPVAAVDTPADTVAYRFIGDGGTGLFGIGAATGLITVAADAALDYERGDTLYTVSVEASDGLAADTAVVTIRITNADDPGVVTLSAAVARVGVPLAAALEDEDGVVVGVSTGWEHAAGGGAAWSVVAGANAASYTPVPADSGRALRAVFTYTDGHGPDKTAVSAAVRVAGANRAPAFGAAAYERAVEENAAAGTPVGGPVAASDADGDTLRYRFVPGGGEALFEIGEQTGRITVGDTTALDYENGDTLHTVRVEASDGTLADTAVVTIHVTDADDPGVITLSAAVGRVGARITATLMDQDRSVETSKVRRWEVADPGIETWTAVPGATTRHYTPAAADEGKRLRAVFTYTDGDGPNKTATSAAVPVTGGNVAPVFATSAPTRRVAENSPGGTPVGAAVTAADANEDPLAYRILPGGGAALFDIGERTGQITVAEGAALDYEGGTRSYTVTVEASDGELADTATVTIRVTNADDPGSVVLNAGIARVGVQLAATLMDQDGSLNAGKRRRWERSADQGATWTAIAGATTRFYTPPAGDEGKRLRAVFTYRDRHGPNKTAVSDEIGVVGAATPVASFAIASYTVPAGGSVDIAVTASHPSPATADIRVSLVAGTDTTFRTVTLPPGATQATLDVSAAGRAGGDTIAVRLGTLPAGWVAGPPSETRIAVTGAGGGTGGDADRAALSVSFAEASYEVAAGGGGTVITLRIAPAADRGVSVALTTTGLTGVLDPDGPAGIPAAVAFEPGDSLATFTFTAPPASPGGEIALSLGELPHGVDPGTPATALVTVVAAAAGTDALFDESLEAGLAVLGRAVAEGAGQAVRGRLAAAMRAGPAGEATAPARSARGWAALAAGELASLSGVPTSTAALRGAAQAPAQTSPEFRLPGTREAVRRLLPRLSFSAPLGQGARAAAPPRFSLWAHGSAQQYRGEPGSSSAASGGLSYDGAMQAFTAGADARLGSSALAGLALMRSSGEFNYANRSLEGTLGHAMNTVHPYLFLRPSARIGLWAIGGLGSGDLDDQDGGRTLPARLRMLSGGAEIPLARRGALGLALAADAFGVSTRTGASGNTPEREGTATRARALLEASWKSGGLSLATRAGARYDGGDADTGAGAETGGSLALRSRGLDLALDTRAAFGSEGHREWGASLRIAYDPGTPGQGLRIAVSPARGRPQSNVRGLLDHGYLNSGPAHGDSWRLDAETGYALPGIGNGSLDTYTRLSAHGHLRLWSAGARYDMNRSLQLTLESNLNHTANRPRGLKMGLGFTF